MFHPASQRWDVCEVLAITIWAVHVRAVDRVHPYPYLYPNFKKASEWISLTSPRLKPYLSRVTRPEPRIARKYDLVDVFDKRMNVWRCAEVCSNITMALWILYIDDYKSCNLLAVMCHPF